VIPIQRDGRLTDFYDRDAQSARAITAGDLIEAATGIGDLVDILSQRVFCFVLQREEIAGYVHFSDLNNPHVKLAFYAIFEAFERCLLSKLPQVGESELAGVVGPKRLKRINAEMQKARGNEANLGLENFLFLPELLRMARSRGELRLRDEQIKLVKIFRNRVSLAGWMLIQDRTDLESLARVKETCLSTLVGDAPREHSG